MHRKHEKNKNPKNNSDSVSEGNIAELSLWLNFLSSFSREVHVEFWSNVQIQFGLTSCSGITCPALGVTNMFSQQFNKENAPLVKLCCDHYKR